MCSRSFKESWYDSHKWLCGSFYEQRLYCWPCVLLGKVKNVWSSDGYFDLKNLSKSVKKHEASKDHINNFIGLVWLEKNKGTIIDALNEGFRLSKILYNDNVRKNRLVLLQIIEIVILLSEQKLAFRGHDESTLSINQGNFVKYKLLEVIECIRDNSESGMESINGAKDQLKNELSVIYFDEQFHNQSIQQCVKLLKEFEESGLLKEAYKLFCIVLTIPSSSVTVERKFSCLKRIKSYLRNSMTEERLSSLATISIEKDLINTLLTNDEKFYEKIIDKCALLKNRRIDLIYKT
ncbi:zinc finger MYM-type protein 1-like [Melanaphis sacchari]|uniref:zinc finger MYM-type protein 1-like n=1 Tax=Melanaphis sacchari TaxID=742174 RepID=UPI000DC14EB2|nr:zinc finger MYM-type protein 1-like [Melanaphis sacchari]